VAADSSALPLPAGPVVYLVRRTRTTASAFALGAVVNGSLVPLPSEATYPGAAQRHVNALLPAEGELVLFADGIRAGTFISNGGGGVDTSFCVARPRADGLVELIPGADEETNFLALPAEAVEGVLRESWGRAQATSALRAESLARAGELLSARGAPRTQPNLSPLQRDLTVLTLRGGEAGELLPHPFATTIVNDDQLRVGEPGSNGWSLFFVARHDGTRYRPTLVRYSLFSRDGKAAPRLLAWADTNGDGRETLLLELFGTTSSWLGVAGFADGEWKMLLEDACEDAPA